MPVETLRSSIEVDLPQFEEKQYESALSHELTAGVPTAYPSGQVLEALVGYDIALQPGDPKIWDLLEAGFPPGIVLMPGLWRRAPKTPPGADLPRDLVSLILQVKRPERLDHWRAGQDHYWRRPYFRFHINEEQQAQLAGLEIGVKDRALVRYAAAAFLTLDSLYEHQRKRTVADHSTFVAPAVLTGHRLWSYAGPGTIGYANQEGVEGPADTRETLMRQAGETAPHESLADHVERLAEVAGREFTSGDWVSRLFPPTLPIPPDRLRAAIAWATFADAVSGSGGEWFVLDFSS